jgi:hypothetical protein
LVFKSSLENSTKIKSEPKCDKEIPKKLAENWQKNSRKNGNIATKYSLNFYFSHFWRNVAPKKRCSHASQ